VILNNFFKNNLIDMKQLFNSLITIVYSTHHLNIKLSFLLECERNYQLLTKKEQASFNKLFQPFIHILIIDEEYELLNLLKLTNFLKEYENITCLI
jgi:hypothetical protein